jgi:predicted secreted protein
MATAPTGKLQGFKSTFHYTAPGGGAAVKLKSISGWDLTIKLDEEDASDHDTQGWKEKLPGMADWSATAKALYFEGDVTQQGLVTALIASLQTASVSAPIACTFEPIDEAAGMAFSGNAYITSYKHSTANGSVQGIDISLSGTGALTYAAQATAD